MNTVVLNYNICFAGRRRKPENIEKQRVIEQKQNAQNMNFGFSKKAKKLYVALESQINDDWKEIKKSQDIYSLPKYVLSGKSGEFVTIYPAYGGIEPKIIFNVVNGRYCEQFVFSRPNPEKFKYYKMVETDYGSAILKSYDSAVQTNNEMIKMADEKISKYVPKILSKENKERYFGRYYGNKKLSLKIDMD